MNTLASGGALRRRLLAAGAAALLLAGTAPAALAQALVPVRIAGIAVNNPNAAPSTEQKTNGPLGYAIARGTFQSELEKHGFRFAGFQGFPRTAAALLALSANETEVALTGDSPAVLSRARGDKQRAIYVSQPDADAWVVGRADGPDTLAALSGKRVGALFGSIFDYYARNVFDTLGIRDQVSYAQLQVSAALPALQRGDLDAYVTVPATAALWAQQYGLKVIAKASETYPQWQTTTVATANQAFLDQHPQLPAAFWAGIQSGIQAIEADVPAYLAWEAEVTGLPLPVIEATARTSFSDVPVNADGVVALQRLLDYQLASEAAKNSFVVTDWVVTPAP